MFNELFFGSHRKEKTKQLRHGNNFYFCDTPCRFGYSLGIEGGPGTNLASMRRWWISANSTTNSSVSTTDAGLCRDIWTGGGQLSKRSNRVHFRAQPIESRDKESTANYNHL